MNSKPITFADIFDYKVNKETAINSVEIPIIQRDYAQGRDSKEVKRIRDKFLNVLYNALTDSSKTVKLDFIYGNAADGKLIPLDGQQRLTTLFLLHWYIAKREKVPEQKYGFLNNFTYRTRFSSAHFCESLIPATPDFNVELLSDWLTDQNWYMYSWDKDPTISSMLVMLNDIHSLFKNESGLWEKITNTSTPPISFYFLPLEEMGLTDSLYIKMNSRGKPLTNFEHFKAEFEAVIKNVSTDLYNEFTAKADNDWVDMLWKYRGDDNAIDDEFMRYFRFVTEIICFQNYYHIDEDDFDLAINVYGKQNDNVNNNLSLLFNAFDCWTDLENIDVFFENIFTNDNFETGKVALYTENINLFLACCNSYGQWSNRRREFTLGNTLLLYATLVYLLNADQISKDEFIERIRIVRNLITNSPDEIREDRMKTLLNDTNGIILNGEIITGNLGFNEVQKNQELQKITWRREHSELINDLNQLEDHFLLQGTVAIIGLDDAEKFRNRAVNFKSLFNKEIDYIKISKALLTIDDYSQLASWRFLFGNKNESSWRELFTISKQRKGFENTKSTLLRLLDSLTSDFNSYLDGLIEAFINNETTPKNWRYYFVKYSPMRYGRSGVYYWRNDPSRTKIYPYELFMMNTPLSLNGRHWDPFLYTIYLDENFKDNFTLEEYGAPLISDKNEKIRCLNEAWYFYDGDGNLIKKIDIPQENGIDKVDRIELLKENVLTNI
jgi:hypothetical protein